MYKLKIELEEATPSYFVNRLQFIEDKITEGFLQGEGWDITDMDQENPVDEKKEARADLRRKYGNE